MPLLVYSVLRLGLFGACWVALLWAGFVNPWVAAVVAAFAAWGLSYVALPGPRDAAARWLAAQDARRKGGSPLSARARQDAADEDALVEARDEGVVGGTVGAAPDGVATDEPLPESGPDEGRDESSTAGARFLVSPPTGAELDVAPEGSRPDQGPDEPASGGVRPDADRRGA